MDAPPGELSGLRLLLDQLDALLRDPTLARALRNLSSELAAGVRGLGAATVAAATRLARSIARLRLPRRILLGLLAMTLPLALLALLTSSGDERATQSASGQQVRPPAPPAGGRSPAALGMPNLLEGPAKVAPVSVVLVLDHSYRAARRRRELRSLGTWLAEHHAPATRVSVIDAGTARTSGPLRASQLARARPARPQTSATAAIRSAFARQNGRRLLVTLGAAAPRAGTASTLSVATRGGGAAASGVAVRRGRSSRVTVDQRRPDALAGSVARAIMAISGQRERG